jgi:hypothetical protein
VRQGAQNPWNPPCWVVSDAVCVAVAWSAERAAAERVVWVAIRGE